MSGPIKKSKDPNSVNISQAISETEQIKQKTKAHLQSSIDEWNKKVNTKTKIDTICDQTLAIKQEENLTSQSSRTTEIQSSTEQSGDIKQIDSGIYTEIDKNGEPINVPSRKFEDLSSLEKEKFFSETEYSSTPNDLNKNIDLREQHSKKIKNILSTSKTLNKITPEEKNERSRLYEQAVLMLNYKELCQKSLQDKRFTNFGRVVSSGGINSAENPAELINLLFKKKIKFDLLKNATSAQMSCLLPVIRIFKQYKSKDKKSFLNLELPLEQQYKLEDFETIFTDKKSRGGGIGLKNVSITNLGKDNLATVDNYNFTISFNVADINELTKVRYTYTTSKEEQSKGFAEEYSVSFFDLVFPNNKNGTNIKNSPDSYDKSDFVIKVVFGWHVNRQTKPEFMTQDFIDEIEQLKETFYLTKRKHDMNFDEFGGLELKISYITYFDSIIKDPRSANLLFNPEKDSLKDAEQEEKRINLRDQRQALLKEINDPNISDKLKEIKKKELKTLEKEIKDFGSFNLENRYRRFINNIYNKGNIKFITVSEESYSGYELILNNISSKTEKIFDDLSELQTFIDYSNDLKTVPIDLSISQTEPISPLSKIPNNFKNEKERSEQYKKKISETSNKLLQIIKATKNEDNKKKNDKIKIIPFFYLGDLIDAILEDGVFGGNNFYEKKIKVLTGPMYFFDFGDLTYQSMAFVPTGINDNNNIKRKIKWEPQARIINIADIPISLTLYQQWFIDEIVNKGLNTLTFQDFIYSLINKLFIVALGNRVYPWSRQQPNRLVLKQIALHEKLSRWRKKDFVGDLYEQDTDYTKEHFTDNNLLIIDNIFKNTEEYEFVYYISGVNDSHRFNSVYEEDIKIGIRHLYFQSETGFVKNIKFSRTDLPFLEASLITNSQNVTMAHLMSGIYNADIEMIGNSFFKLGEKVYINPTIGANGLSNLTPVPENRYHINNRIITNTDALKAMGIGGYYIITDISTNFGPGQYNTSIKCRYEKQGIENSVDYRIDITSELETAKKVNI